MTRRSTATLAMALLLGLAAFDAATSELNPFQAPPIIALGSGQQPGGAHCASLPK